MSNCKHGLKKEQCGICNPRPRTTTTTTENKEQKKVYIPPEPRKKISSDQKPLILISPPGSIEAREIGYINIPKIEDDPPTELEEVQQFEDNTEILPPELGDVEKFTDDKGRKFSLRQTHVWLLKDPIEKIVRSSKIVTTIIPEVFEYAIPWILCEYGLYCTEEGEKENLELFTKNVIKRRFSDWYVVGEALFEKRWRNAKKVEKEAPIRYLRVVAKRKVIKEKYKTSSSLFGPEILSLDKPIVTSDTVTALESGEGEALCLGDLIDNSMLRSPGLRTGFKHDGKFMAVDDKKTNYERLSLRENLIKASESSKLSSNATDILIDSIENVTTLKDASDLYGLTKTEYNAARREINRKKETLRKKFVEFYYPKID